MDFKLVNLPAPQVERTPLAEYLVGYDRDLEGKLASIVFRFPPEVWEEICIDHEESRQISALEILAILGAEEMEIDSSAVRFLTVTFKF